MTDKVDEARDMASTKLIADISEAELACRIFEAITEAERPKGMSAEEAMSLLDEENLGAMRRAANATMRYWQECIMGAAEVDEFPCKGDVTAKIVPRGKKH